MATTTFTDGDTVTAAAWFNDVDALVYEGIFPSGLTSLVPDASDGASLGTTALPWSDLHLASGGVINFNNGAVTVTQSSGQLIVSGTTGSETSAASTFTMYGWNKATSGDNSFIEFATEAGYSVRGTITYNRGGGVTAYNTSSDYRITSVKGEVTNASEILSGLNPIWGRMKDATIDIVKLVAHETQPFAPWVVTGEKDAVDGKGEPIYQQVNYGMLTPLLVAGWKEHETGINELKKEIDLLKARRQ